MSSKEFLLKLKNKPYIEVILTSANNVSKKYHIEDIGYRWLLDDSLGVAFILPDTRIEGLKEKRKTTLFYSIENALPLKQIKFNEEDKEFIYHLTDKNQIVAENLTEEQLKPTKYKSVKPVKFIPAVIDSRVLASLINQKVVTDLLRPSISKWEALKLPLIVAAIAACIIGLSMF